MDFLVRLKALAWRGCSAVYDMCKDDIAITRTLLMRCTIRHERGATLSFFGAWCSECVWMGGMLFCFELSRYSLRSLLIPNDLLL